MLILWKQHLNWYLQIQNYNSLTHIHVMGIKEKQIFMPKENYSEI